MFSSARPKASAHLPAEAVTVGTRRRQVCAWCGAVLDDVALLNAFMSDGGEIPIYDPEHWYGFDGAAAWQAAPADEPPADACCREETT